MLKGLPASGKSTYAVKLLKKEPGKWKRINKDSLRSMFDDYLFNRDNENFIYSIQKQLIISSLKKGMNVVCDNTNLSAKSFKELCEIAENIGDIVVEEKNFEIDVEECIRRDAGRTGHAHVGEDVIRMFYKRYSLKHGLPKEKSMYFEKKCFQESSLCEQDETLPKVAIFDNDGTISLIHPGRSPYDARTCDQDLPHTHVIEALQLYFNAGYKIIFISGREEKNREPTEKFYKMYFPKIKYELYMRATGDKRKDVVIKEEIYNNFIKNKYNVAAWFDDRLQVCRWIYQKGLPLFRVNNPEAAF